MGKRKKSSKTAGENRKSPKCQKCEVKSETISRNETNSATPIVSRIPENVATLVGKGTRDDNEHLNMTEVGKRKITHTMDKNKGLMPQRQRHQRNPRVKHRDKFRIAKIRRKGKVTDVRTEASRYGGEMFGINSAITKSIKFKY